jgi:hypothetical protein
MGKVIRCGMTVVIALCVLLGYVTQALCAEEYNAEAELNRAATLIDFNRIQEAGDLCRSIAVKHGDTPSIALRALHLWAKIAEIKNDVPLELACYQQMIGYNWRPLLGSGEAQRMTRRIAEMSEDIAASDDYDRALRDGTIILQLIDKVGVLDKPGVTARLRKSRARAFAAIGNASAARQELAIVIHDTAATVAERLEAASACVNLNRTGNAQDHREFIEIIISGEDNDSLFVSEVALAKSLMRMALTHNELWPETIVRMKIVFFLCPADYDHRMILQELCATFAEAQERTVNSIETATLKEYAKYGPTGRDDIWYTADDLIFPLTDTPGALPGDEEKMIKTNITKLHNSATVRDKIQSARLSLLICDINGAVIDFHEAFAKAERGTKLQKVALDGLIGAAKSRGGKFLNPEPFYQFLTFGKEGRDGIDGTFDDLRDPMPQLLAGYLD